LLTIVDTIYQHFIRPKIGDLSLEDLMNGPVKKALGLQVTHGRQSNTVFAQLREDFMKPVIHTGIS